MAETYDSFRTYLEVEVLQSTAERMGWVDATEEPYVASGTSLVQNTILGKRDAQSVYDAITNEVLLQMGVSTPDLVPDEDYMKMRALGRVEAWRAVCYNLMSDTDLNIGDSGISRSEAFTTSNAQLSMAEADYESQFGSITPTITSPRAATYSGGVTVRW